MKQLNDPKWALTVAHLEACCMHSRVWSEMVSRYVKLHGDVDGIWTSGVYNPAWPDEVKMVLREHAHFVTGHSAQAYRLKPKGARTSTVRSIASFIARRDGSGFYGPQK